jgi:hypothetical protein
MLSPGARKNKRDDGAETRADFGAFRGAESAALRRYSHGATRSYTRVLYAGVIRGWKDDPRSSGESVPSLGDGVCALLHGDSAGLVPECG